MERFEHQLTRCKRLTPVGEKPSIWQYMDLEQEIKVT